MQPNVIEVLQNGGGPAEQQHSHAHHRLRLYQVFVNIEGLEVRIKQPLLGFIPRTKKKEFGFYAVMMLAAPEASLPPLLLSLAKEALADEFESLSRTTPEEWTIEQVEWRETGMAPPMFQQPGCVDQDWGAAWYELGDEKAKKHRYRLAKTRLWKGRRAKKAPVTS
jgi:hypothetical protein